MRNLINRLLVKLGLRKPIEPANLILRIEDWQDGSLEEKFSDIGWKFYGGYGRMNNQDIIVRGEIVDE